MLKDRILFTLKFFDLQNTPLTLSQLRDFLLNEPATLKSAVSSDFEINAPIALPPAATEAEIQQALVELSQEVEEQRGLYCLRDRAEIITEQLENASYRLKRERLVRMFVPNLRFVPFVRGVGVGGSQTLGHPKKESDIDLLVILDSQFFWLGRLLVTGYFQMTTRRRHGRFIADRFCLNHYLAGPIAVTDEKDPYNAMEYLRLRPEVYGENITAFVRQNEPWIRQFFPQAVISPGIKQNQSRLQRGLEKLFKNFLGRRLNASLGKWQMKRIRRGEPAVATEAELSFHSKQRKFEFLAKFFQDQQ